MPIVGNLEAKFSAAFENWFKSSTVDFWSESSAPDELAAAAQEIIKQELLPKLIVAAEALAVLEHHVLPQHARVATAALDLLREK